MAKATQDTSVANEVVKSGGNFKHSVEVQNLYRFIAANGLRREAQMVMAKLVTHLQPKKKRRGRKKAQKVLH